MPTATLPTSTSSCSVPDWTCADAGLRNSAEFVIPARITQSPAGFRFRSGVAASSTSVAS